MSSIHIIMFLTFVVAAFSQRSPYAGRSGHGYPLIEVTSTTSAPLGNRLASTQSTETLPIEIMGDREAANRFSKLPEDKQPFWFLNRAVLEDFRKNVPTYEQKENSFLADIAWSQAQNPRLNQNLWE